MYLLFTFHLGGVNESVYPESDVHEGPEVCDVVDSARQDVTHLDILSLGQAHLK